ncbi:hypothetical protein [Amycolatopsis sp. RTGN1]|uniref:hypothetical protein n=1 Tax=Amycolatopsis ponsaeliensis TaxID=2992142 RepID=UPI0025512C8D|nr:hypothetical protein [Amycolatopsis sp. RTGN1]
MTNDREEPDRTDVPGEARPAETLDRGLAPPSVVPEITSTHPLDRGLAPPDDEEETGPGSARTSPSCSGKGHAQPHDRPHQTW